MHTWKSLIYGTNSHGVALGVTIAATSNPLPPEISDDVAEEHLYPDAEGENRITIVENLPKNKYLKFGDTMQKQYLAFTLKICEQFPLP